MGEDDYSWLMDGGLDGSGVDWASIIGSQPENGSAIGPDGTDANGLTPEDWSAILAQAGEGLNPDGTENYGPDPSGGIDWSKILGMLGGGKGIAGLAGILATIGGGVYAHNSAKHATDAALSRIGDAENKVTGILGNSSSLYQPYTDLGKQGAAGMSAFPTSALGSQFGSLAQNFQPLGTGHGIVGGAGAPRVTLGTMLGRR